MKALITGASGFIGQKLVISLKDSPSYTHLLLTDVIQPNIPQNSSAHIESVKSDLTKSSDREDLITPDLDVVFILHGVMSGAAEANFDLGFEVNFEATKGLLAVIRRIKPGIKVVFASSLAVFGGNLPPKVSEETMPTPASSYGMEKMLCEYLINDHSRRGLIDGRILRFPTIVVRPGAPSGAASSFVSGIIREPLNNETSVLPVSRNLELWICSPRTVVENIIHAVRVPAEKLGLARQVNIPGITVTVGDMLEALKRVAGDNILELIDEKKDEAVEKIVGSWPAKFDITRAKELEFEEARSFDEAIAEYIRDENIKLS